MFALSMLKVRAVARRSMRSHRYQWPCHCLTAVMLAFVLRAPRRSAFFKDAVGFIYLILFIQYFNRVTHLAVIAILPCGPLCKHIYMYTNTKVI